MFHWNFVKNCTDCVDYLGKNDYPTKIVLSMKTNQEFPWAAHGCIEEIEAKVLEAFWERRS